MDRFSKRFEQGLEKLAAGLLKKRGCRVHAKIMERLGRLKERYAYAAQHYKIEIAQDTETKHVSSITWCRHEAVKPIITHPGVYCLRTDQQQWDAATIWNTYTMLTDLESVFRSMKSELGLRPVYHQKGDRVDAHLFITILAYHLVHGIRYQLKAKGIDDSWERLRNRLSSQIRITITMTRQDGELVHLRKSSRAEPHQQAIYNALGLPHHPGKTLKMSPLPNSVKM
ncbi:MAG: transposase [Magnetococcales bacterium]|nr:transposase [Magnetococcales bacterium]